MNRSRNGLLLFVIASLVAGRALLRAQDTGQTKAIQMVLAYATLTKPLDAKKAKPGDPVAARLVYEVKIPGATPLPRNTLLEGRIDAVRASQKRSDSFIEVTFNTAQLKDGQTIPIKATIMNISEMASPFGADNNDSSSNDDAMTRSAPRPMLDNTRIVSTDAPNSANPVPEQNPDIAGGTPGGTQRKTHVSGVTLQSDIHQPESGTIRATRKNVNIPSGASLAFALAEVPSGAGTQ